MLRHHGRVHLCGSEHWERNLNFRREHPPIPDENGMIRHGSFFSKTSKFTNHISGDISRLPNLKELRVTGLNRCFVEQRPLSVDTIAPTLEPPIVQQITSVTIVYSLVLNEVLMFMLLPRIHTITAHHIAPIWSESDCQVSMGNSRSTLRRLILYGLRSHCRKGSPIFESVVKHIVYYSPLLEELRWVPNLIVQETTGDQSINYERPINISANPLMESLQIVRHSLTTLELALDHAALGMPWHKIGHGQGFPMDFSSLPCLKFLKINHFFMLPFFPMWNSSIRISHREEQWNIERQASQWSQRQNICQNLPPNIQKVHVSLFFMF